MKFNLKRMALAAILMSSTSVALADDNSTASVGDLPGFGEDAYFDDGSGYVGDEEAYDEDAFDNEPSYDNVAAFEDAADVEDNGIAQASVVEDYAVEHSERPHHGQVQYAPVNLSALQPATYQDGYAVEPYVGGSCSPACGCESECDGGCDSASSFRKACGLGKLYDCNTWATYEALLWFPENRYTPALVTSSAPGTLPILSPGGNPATGVNTLFGGEIDGGLSAGFRADYGKWISKNVGLGGRFWWIGDNETDLSLTNLDGLDASVGRPFFEVNPAAPNGVGESALLVAFNDGTTILTGDVIAESELQMLGAEAYGRFRMGCSKNHQLDFIGGYSHFRINDAIGIASETTTIASDPLNPPPGTVRRFADLFDAENRFHGGQIGFDLSATRGCWTVKSLTKVHLGNMNQRISRDGLSFVSIGGAPGTTNENGFLVTSNNDGVIERDKFTFVPEANFKVAYRFREHVSLSVGYSFLFFSDVALAGNAIDRAVDGPLAGTGQTGISPAPTFRDDSLWVHGIDLGAVIDF